MLFGRNTNNQNSTNVNTIFSTTYSDYSSLSIGGWNDMISLRFNPATGKDANGLVVYDKERRISTSLTMNNAWTLLKRIKEVIIPAYEKNDPENGKSVTVSMGSNSSKNTLTVEYKNDETNTPSFYLVFATNVDANGIANEENIITYKFNKTEYIDNYNPRTAGGTPGIEEAEFFNFVEKLEHRNEISGMIAHSIKYKNALANRSGNGAQSNNSNNGNNNSYMSNFGNNSFDINELPFN